MARPFIPGFVGTLDALGGSRVDQIVERVLALPSHEVTERLAQARELFGHRHRDLEARWEEHFLQALPHSPRLHSVEGDIRSLIGAYFTQEYSFEAAALCNPSI
ncbi:MAG TPA: glycosidase-like protein, partial [Acidimicrobiia bacterium]|nr:glycosidase-like protein [Acidimicrobiia bacterium]